MVKHVLDAVMILLGQKELTWIQSKKFMANIDGFIKMLKNYDKDNISNGMIKKVSAYVKEHDLTPENVSPKSCAAAGLCTWVIGIIDYHNFMFGST